MKLKELTVEMGFAKWLRAPKGTVLLEIINLFYKLGGVISLVFMFISNNYFWAVPFFLWIISRFEVSTTNKPKKKPKTEREAE